MGKTHNIGIQIKRKEIPKTFMLISNLKKNTFKLYKNNSLHWVICNYAN